MNGGFITKAFIYVYKGWSATLEVLGRLYIFNWFLPLVKDVVRSERYGGDSRKQALDVIVPCGKPPFPVLVLIHGGGYIGMDKRSYRRIARCLASKGCLVVSINYRLAPGHTFPTAFQDIDMAVAWARDNAEQYGGDASRMFIAGDSAGAYFSSMYAAALLSPKLASSLSIERAVPPDTIKGLLLFYGGYDLDTILETGFPFIKVLNKNFFGCEAQVYGARAEVASPARHITAGYPPTFLASGSTDKLHSQSVEFERTLTDAGILHTSLFFTRKEHPFAFKGHGFLSVSFGECSRIALREAGVFLAGRM